MNGKRIVVAMSGGVDSSTAAAILARQGHDVIGIGLKLPDSFARSESVRSCCGIAGMDDARRVAEKIGIPFYVLDYEKIFEETVVNYFCGAYLQGETPNPCVECNRVVKFGHLLRMADGLEADCVASGHYARVSRDAGTGRFLLKKGMDREKDQSYFLYPLSQEQLSRVVFPLGEMTKDETRDIARSFGLPVAEKPASQDICFVGDEGYGAMLAERFQDATRRGPILNAKGDIIGEHRGAAFYTVGQRRGLGIAGRTPLYVLNIDIEKRAITVGRREELARRRISVKRINWIARDKPSDPIKLSVRIRYRQPEAPAIVRPTGDNGADIEFLAPQYGVAPGQSAVFYDGDLVVGGGIIEPIKSS